MAIVRWKPMRDISVMQDEINRVFDNFWGGFEGQNGAMMAPPVDVTEKADNFIVSADLPGLKKGDIKLTLQNNVLTISGSKNRETESKDDRYHRVERSFGSFCRTVNFPTSVDASKINADFKDGVLIIELPKVEEAKPKEIAIQG